MTTTAHDPTRTVPDTGSPPVQETALVPVAESLPVLDRRSTDVPDSLDERLRVAEKLAESGILPEIYRGKPGNVLAVEFAAAALQLPLFMAFQHMHFVKGKLGQSAEMMRTLILRAGHRYNLVANRAEARMQIIRNDGTVCPEVVFTLNDAVAAGLCHIKEGRAWARSKTGEPLPWEAHTESMLTARVTSKAARMYTPEVLAGMSYTPDELEEVGVRGVVEQMSTPMAPTGQQAPAGQVLDGEVVQDQPSGDQRAPWTAQRAVAALLSIDPADPEAKDKLGRLWKEARADGVFMDAVEGQPLGVHWTAARDAILKRGEHYNLGAAADSPDDGVVDAEIIDDTAQDVDAVQRGPEDS